MPSIPQRYRAIMRPAAAAMEPYDPQAADVRINLSANENTHGLGPVLRLEVDRALADVVTNRYPDPLAGDLRRAIAQVEGVDPSCVILGNGGDELIFNLFLAFCDDGSRVLTCPPTFAVYGIYAELVGAQVVEVPRDPATFEVRAREVVEVAASARVVCLTSPNNPTGTLVDPALVREVCAACPGIVLADEAYMEFAPTGSSARPLLDECDNLVILHTFSKAFCLAGARVGYVLANPGIISALAAVRQPYSVSSLDQAAALAVMGRRDAMAPVITSIMDQRELVREELAKLPGATVWPSAANFLFVRLPRAHEVWERLRDEHSILVRDFSANPACPDCLRITVGTPGENAAVIKALSQLVKE